MTLLKAIVREVIGQFNYSYKLWPSGYTDKMVMPNITIDVSVQIARFPPYLLAESVPPVRVRAGESIDITLSEGLFTDPDNDDITISWALDNNTGILFQAAPFSSASSSTLKVSPPRHQVPRLYLVNFMVAKVNNATQNNTYLQWIFVDPPAPLEPKSKPKEDSSNSGALMFFNITKKEEEKEDSSMPNLNAFLDEFAGKIKAT